MTIWLEFPLDKLTKIKTAYDNERVQRRIGDDYEKIQDHPMVDATGTRMMVGTSRLSLAAMQRFRDRKPVWLVIHRTFPADWEYPA